MNKFLFFLCCFTVSCSAGFQKGGYYFAKEDKNPLDNECYYGNDRKKIYFRFSEKYSYSKQNFNADKIKSKDILLLKELDIKPSRKLLFSYHSFGRDMIAMLESRSFPGEMEYRKIISENGKSFWYRFSKSDSAIVIDNLYPFGKKYIRVIEKTKMLPNTKSKNIGEKQETFIFPEISMEKPF